MTILITGATGRIGRHLVQTLAAKGAALRVLTRDPAKAQMPTGVEIAQGDLLNLSALRKAFEGVRTLFLLNAVTGDEYAQALITLNLAREAGVQRIVYLSVFHADRFANVPHFSVKHAVEQVIAQMGFSATILRPTYFIDNEVMVRDVIVTHGVYPMPVGGKGLAMVDARDIAEVAAHELLRRDGADLLPLTILPVVGPQTLTGPQIADLWTQVLGRPVVYGGDDPAGFEANLGRFMAPWAAYEMRLMAERYVTDGMIPAPGDAERLTAMLGRPLHRYRETAEALA
jgi:uncharacterized protein YbjT (DUF2867 family)